MLTEKEMIVQLYVCKPLLLDEVKFDIKVFVCIFGLNPLQAFLCDEGISRFCTESYKRPKKSNFKNTNMHMTHETDSKRVNADEIFDENNGIKRTLTSLWKSLGARGIDTKIIKENIRRTCSLTMQLYGPLIE